ncbi:MAG: hypothetical protein ACXACY_23465 [Candidatus Hodarchaeales archaeon]
MIGADVLNYIDQDVKDGVEGIKIFGVPKSGKSNLMRRINKDCMLRHKENLIMPGTVNCEWRNLLYHKDKPVRDYKILLPEGIEFGFHNITHEIKQHIEYINYDNLKIADYLEDNEQFLLVVYDNHFDDLLLHHRIAIWNNIAKQLIRRMYSLEQAIGLCFDEGGIYFPQISLGDHYAEIYRFSNLVVDFRKNNIRLQLISQLDTEMLNTISEKQFWTILRKGVYSKRIPRKARRVTPFYAIDQYTILEGGIYTSGNTVVKMKESDRMMKIVPQSDPQIETKENQKIKNLREQRDKTLIALYDKGLSSRQIAGIVGLGKSRVAEIVANA